MLRVGLVGIGFMGWIHYLAYQRVRGVKLAAVCELDEKRLSGDWRDIKGNFGPPGEIVDLSTVAKYRRFEELLADKSIDYVDICLPPALHAPTAIAACQAGKHVFCEKPICLTTAEADKMVVAATKAGKQLLIGHVLPFLPEYDFAQHAIRDGKYGKLLGAHFKRVISDPTWLKNFYDPKIIGGPLLDLHIHDAHFIRLVCGMPQAVSSRGRMRGEVVEFVETQFTCRDPEAVITATSGVIRQQGRSFTHAFEIHLEKATLLFDSAVLDGQGQTLMPLTVLDSKGKVVRPEVGGGDPISGFTSEIKEVVKAIQTGSPSPILGGDLARDALRLCQAQTASVKSGKPVRLK